ncbi:T9SS type B sorting domain-containing protein [Tamlana sp. 62-3]|uniref:T9SS type B sorting domain-containing protein n=1 Tax=Neotamlana sargassicola TaxID=2883125 RepID=A0A9X1IA54_9FLAO|nr:choice-of-anchor L domain-containing protein [Tamlana sargassicola]MCB4809169.1 T9SS type B sorting domain-containing protein [Tamlana sargassicola]
MRYFYYILLITLCFSKFSFSQKITIDSSVGLEPLIQNNLVDGCVDISNINSAVNGASTGFPSYGYFERGNSNFPFSHGIVLATGGAESGGNAERTPTLSEGSTTWGTDPDIETALGITNTVNATSIEFDFISISNQFSFNYLFASEEYFEYNPCRLSEGFVFLIKEAGTTDPYQNIALVPSTTTPVSTNSIHPEIFGVCPAQNDQYFDGYNVGDTNYNGRTTILNASGNILPNVTYHIKLIIADITDGTFDSAVFIEGDSFKILDLGEDIETCAASTLLNANINNPLASYTWYLDGNLISGAISPTYNATESGTYNVEVTVPVNGSDCMEEDEIIITLNSEEPIDPISNYELCDDPSEDGIEVFDLSTKNDELIANIPFTNYDFSYHYSDLNARNNINPILTPISNASNPQLIYVRIDDLDSDCFAYTTFNLVVNSLPDITTPTDLNICDADDNPDGFTIIDLSEKNDEITGGESTYNVTYHYNSLDATTGDNPISIPYINSSTPNETVYVRVVDASTGCVNTTTLSVNITVSPIVNRDTQYLDACDSDLDGSASFDLTEVIDDILNGLTGVSTTFHTYRDDAETGDNPIADETNYQFTNAISEPGSATIYLRIVDDASGCHSIVPFEIHTNLLLTGTNTGDYALCDDNDDENDTLNFNLLTVEAYISNDLPLPVTVTFFETEEDRDNNVNALDKSQLYEATSPDVLYIRLDNGECSENSQITLLVNPILLFENVVLPYCDDDDDGIASIDLHSLDGIITNDNSNFVVTYFETDSDAQININQLPPFYNNTNPVETLYARIEAINSGCFTVNPFRIEVYTAPTTNQPDDIIICDNDQDGETVVNLNDKIPEIISDTSGLEIDFFISFEDADLDQNPIPENQRNSYTTSTQTIYVRVEDIISETNCYSIVPFEIIVNTLPNFPTISNYQICEDDGDAFADFLLSEKDEEILNGQTGKEVLYFEDAALTTQIDKNTVYRNQTSPQTIYVKVENITDPDCYGTSSFLLQVSPDPVYNPVIDYLICDDDSNDGIHNFDLSAKATEISQGSPDALNISFHSNRVDAQNNQAPLPLNFTNTSNPQSLYVRIESEDSLCFVVEELGINIISTPDITPVTAPLVACDTDYDGETIFDLTTADYEILDRLQDNLIINYFENFEDINPDDGLDNSQEITDPTAFSSVAKTVYIKVANEVTGCYSINTVELLVNLPPATNNITTVEICDNETNTYDLSLVNNMLVNDTTAVTISYHDTFDDAENNQNPINNTYNYTANSHDIFYRITNPETGCHISIPITLQINENPIPNAPNDLIACDDDFDGLFVFDLTSQNASILNGLNASEYTISYYNNLDDANNATNALSNNYEAFNNEIIYARLENNQTNCFGTTQFSTYIDPLPQVAIEDIEPLCVNDLPLILDASTGNPNDTFLWSTGETTPQIELSDASQVGDYWVTATTTHANSNSCTFTKSFTVVESQSANIEFTTKVDFEDPNSITVNVNGIGNYVFILDDGEPQTSNIFPNVTYGLHTITIRDIFGCDDVTTEVMIVDIPKYFTPNNDSYNDTWHIVGIEEIPGTIVYVYSRYGKLLKTLMDTSLGWDGTFNGYNMPADDYWYVADIIQNGETFKLKGHFSLKR